MLQQNSAAGGADPAEPMLAVEVGGKFVRMAWIDPFGQPLATTSYEVAQFTTLTETLMRFERDAGTPLVGAHCALSINGVTIGDVLVIARGRWTVSRSGLAALFQRPVTVINKVGACAWSLLSHRAGSLVPMGPTSSPDFTRPGRWAIVSIDTGVGLAAINVTAAGETTILECEMGHCGFAPENELEDALLRALRAHGRPVSWEHVLMLPVDGAIWSAPGLPASREARQDLIAALTGAFAGDCTLAVGAWSGAILAGCRTPALASPAAVSAFNARFDRQPSLERLVRVTPRWRMGSPDTGLTGLGAALIHAMRTREKGGEIAHASLPGQARAYR